MIIEIEGEAICKMLVEMARAEHRTVDNVAEQMLCQFCLAWNAGSLYGLTRFENQLVQVLGA